MVELENKAGVFEGFVCVGEKVGGKASCDEI